MRADRGERRKKTPDLRCAREVRVQLPGSGATLLRYSSPTPASIGQSSQQRALAGQCHVNGFKGILPSAIHASV